MGRLALARPVRIGDMAAVADLARLGRLRVTNDCPQSGQRHSGSSAGGGIAVDSPATR
jgi:hypothetical protein